MDDINLGQALSSYTSQSSGAYDPIFDQLIREIRPDWFEDKAQIKKDQLIEMAKNGDKRPNQKKHHLGGALVNYTFIKSCAYDPIFDQLIREIRPDWFENKAQTKKDQLIKMAKNGETKPLQRKHPLGVVLSKYTSRNTESYDPEFAKTIRQLRPDWFNRN